MTRPVPISSVNYVPLKRLEIPTNARMYILAAAALLVIIQSSLTDGFASLYLAAFAMAAALLAEACFGLVKGAQTLHDGSALVTALVLTMLLPNDTHPVLAAAGAAFAIVVVKFPFGALGTNWLNPALGGFFAVRFSELAFHSEANSLTIDTDNVVIQDGIQDIANFLNEKVFSFFHADLPALYINLFSPLKDGMIADRGALALVVCSVIITALVLFRPWQPFVYLAVYGALVWLWGGEPGDHGNVLYALLSGGTFLAAFFLLPDPVTGPKSGTGAFIYAVLAAILTFAFRFFKMEFQGAFFAIFLLNAVMPVLSLVERRLFYERRGYRKET